MNTTETVTSSLCRTLENGRRAGQTTDQSVVYRLKGHADEEEYNVLRCNEKEHLLEGFILLILIRVPRPVSLCLSFD